MLLKENSNIYFFIVKDEFKGLLNEEI